MIVLRKLDISDIYSLEYIETPDLSHDGALAVFTKRVAGVDGGFVPSVFCHDIKASKTVLVCEDAEKPRFLLDGRLVYITNGMSRKQIFISDSNGANATQLTTLKHGVSDYAISDDGGRIAFVTKLWNGETDIFTEMTAVQFAAWERERADEPYVAEDLVYKMDSAFGMYDGSLTQIGLLDITTHEHSMVTQMGFSCSKPAFSHGGQYLAYYGKPHIGAKGNLSEIFIYNIRENDEKCITDGGFIAPDAPPVFSVDDSYIVYSKYDDKSVPVLYKHEVGGDADICLMNGQMECHGVNCRVAGHTGLEYDTDAWQISECGGFIYFTSAWKGERHVYRLALQLDAMPERVTNGNICVHAFRVPRKGRLVYVRGDVVQPADLFMLENGSETRLTRHNTWMNEVENPTMPQELTIKARNANSMIHGWFLPPSQREDGERYPAVLYIHGGPNVCYTYDYWFEAQMLSARGFAVVYCDPRGSAGFGAEFMNAEFGWGVESFNDLLDFLKAAITVTGYIDEKRLGITGGSYGGYMTHKIISRDTRFAAAVEQRTFVNPVTSYGTGDMGFISANPKADRSIKKLLTNRSKTALIGEIDNVKTPLLILHGTNDYRCGFEQAEQLFIAMRDRNPDVPCEMVAFPGENHEITRSGKAHFQAAHLDAMIEWFELFLYGKGAQ